MLPLLKAGQFASPPEPVTDAEGFIREKPWPEVDYLVRMAPLAPDAVIEVFLTLQQSENSWIRRSAIFVGANLPAEKAVQLKPLLEAWEDSGFGYRTDPQDLATLARNLLTGPKPKIGQRLARAIFGPTGVDARGRVLTVIEEYWYEKELPGIVKALGDGALQQTLWWLQDWERSAGNLPHERDYSSVSRPSIETITRNHAGIEDTLIDAVRDAAVTHMQSDPVSAVGLLVANELSLAKRVLLFAAARAIASGMIDPGVVIDATIDLLEEPGFSDPHFRLELAEYFRAVGDRQPERLSAATRYLDRGPFGDRAALTERLRHDDDTDEEAGTRASEYRRRWRHRLLAAVGAEHLSDELRLELGSLEQEDGVIENPTRPDFQLTSWVGPESPLTLDALESMSPAALVTHLATWNPEPDSWHGPSHGGQGRMLTTLLTTAPRALEGETDLALRLRPTYLSAILRGWEAAIQSDAKPDWPQLVGLVRDVLGLPDVSAFEPVGDRLDDERDYAQARHAAVALIEEAVKGREESSVPPGTVDELGRVLLEAAKDSRFWDDYVASRPGEGWDPLNLSINAAWPIQAKAIISFAGSTKDVTLRTEALAVLDDELARDDPYDSLAAVIGESLSRLYLANELWLRARVDQLFGTEESISRSQQIALSIALGTQHVHSITLGIIRGAVIAAMRLKEPMVVGWHGLRPTNQLIGEWIITTHIRGQLPIDDALMVAFFSDEPADVRGDAIGHIAWEFMHAEVVDEEIRVRLEALWDCRVDHVRKHPSDRDELKDFYWFVRSRKFEKAWWVPRLLEAATLHPNLVTHGMIGEDLAAAAAEYPKEVLDTVMALTKLVDDSPEPTMYDLMRYAVPAAIAWALVNEDPELQAKGHRFMNALAERNYINIQHDVYAVDTTRRTED
ncbi:hypothetical protein ASF30_07215 [Leifsonia sp. Leaf264]|nr:hypothetical protein ASF30_07215 [Leifsonia sp. Leaf264]